MYLEQNMATILTTTNTSFITTNKKNWCKKKLKIIIDVSCTRYTFAHVDNQLIILDNFFRIRTETKIGD